MQMAFFFALNLISKPRLNTGAKPLLTLIRLTSVREFNVKLDS